MLWAIKPGVTLNNVRGNDIAYKKGCVAVHEIGTITTWTEVPAAHGPLVVDKGSHVILCVFLL